MPLVNVMVNGRAYTIACDDGEEDHLRELAAHVDSKVHELLESVGQVGDQRLLLMAAVLIADEMFEMRAKLDVQPRLGGDAIHSDLTERAAKSEEFATAILEKSARRMEDIAGRLGHA